MAEHVLVPTDKLWRLPDGLSFGVGAMIEPLQVAMQAVSTSEILPGENAVVLGPGPIGLLTLLSLKAAGVSVYVTGKATDRNRLKLAMSRDIGQLHYLFSAREQEGIRRG